MFPYSSKQNEIKQMERTDQYFPYSIWIEDNQKLFVLRLVMNYLQMIFLSLLCSREKLKETSEIKNASAQLFDGWIENNSCDETKS